MKGIFFLFPMAYIFYFCKNMNPRLYILFSVDDVNNEHVLRIIRNLLLNDFFYK